jgi:hypothetical protein
MGGGKHLPAAAPVGAEPTAAEYFLAIVEHLDGRRQLVRVDPMITAATPPLRLDKHSR